MNAIKSVSEPIRDALPDNSSGLRGWVLYDDSCGFCRKWIPFWSGTLRKKGFAIEPLQTAWVREHLRLTDTELLMDLRLLLGTGEQILGADVYRYLTKRIWLGYPIYIFSNAPFCRALFDLGYHTFATNRFRFSRACGIRNRPDI